MGKVRVIVPESEWPRCIICGVKIEQKAKDSPARLKGRKVCGLECRTAYYRTKDERKSSNTHPKTAVVIGGKELTLEEQKDLEQARINTAIWANIAAKCGYCNSPVRSLSPEEIKRLEGQYKPPTKITSLVLPEPRGIPVNVGWNRNAVRI